jgi:hypothetical protein
MSKIDTNKLAEILKRNLIEPVKLRRILEEVNNATQPDSDKPVTPKGGKTQLCILISDPKGVIPADALVGWVFQLEESASPADLLPRIHKAAYDFNASKKGRLHPVKTIGETIESAPRAYWKREEGGRTTVKTKIPVLVVRTDNVLPTV